MLSKALLTSPRVSTGWRILRAEASASARRLGAVDRLAPRW
jgi:hypothetical protein